MFLDFSFSLDNKWKNIDKTIAQDNLGVWFLVTQHYDTENRQWGIILIRIYGENV